MPFSTLAEASGILPFHGQAGFMASQTLSAEQGSTFLEDVEDDGLVAGSQESSGENDLAGFSPHLGEARGRDATLMKEDQRVILQAPT